VTDRRADLARAWSMHVQSSVGRPFVDESFGAYYVIAGLVTIVVSGRSGGLWYNGQEAVSCRLAKNFEGA
jgi:hypothetical protein